MALILDVLRQSASTFGIQRARFLRQTAEGVWQVHAMQQDKLITHTADYAESAMGWTVALSRFPLRVTRPRITSPSGENVRPIAVTNYLGIPVLCGDLVVGVIELAGRMDGDPAQQVDSLAGIIADLGLRLAHNPQFQPQPELDLSSECHLDGGTWVDGDIYLSENDWTVVSALAGGEPLSTLAARLDLSEDDLLTTVCDLASRGLITS